MVWSKIFGITCGVAFLAGSVSAATLPTAKEVQAKMGMGFNIGNSMEVPNNPTLWGNPFPTQALLDSVKAAGFNTVRIPCAWVARFREDGCRLRDARRPLHDFEHPPRR